MNSGISRGKRRPWSTSTQVQIGGASNVESDLWVKLKMPGESNEQFLCKNLSKMLHHFPNLHPKKHGKCVWQEEEAPKDPENLKTWLGAIMQKYYRVMGKVKPPTTESEGREWKQIFVAKCEQTCKSASA